MRIDFAADPSIEVIETDVAIIGSGPAGTSLASALNRDCCVIESGTPYLDIENHWRFRSINAGERTNVDSLRARGIGGASLRWTGRCIPLDPYDFEDRPWISQTSWPIGYDDLAPWFEPAAALMRVTSGEAAHRFPATEIEDAMAKDGRWRSVLWRFADDKKRGVFRFGEHLAHVFESERRHLFYNAHCTQMLANGAQVKALVVETHEGRKALVRANHFVVAAGCVENARLLLDTKRENPALLGVVEPWLGRGFSQHLRVDAGTLQIAPKHRRALQRHMTIFRDGPASVAERGFAIDPDFARREKVGNASLVLRYAPKGHSGPRDLLERASAKALGHPVALSDPEVQVEIDTEQTVSRDSRIELDETPDTLGRPRARIHWSISETDCRTAYVAAKAFGDFAQAAGLGEMTMAAGLEPTSLDPDIRRDSNHQLGGTRMSETAADGVVDRNLTVHGVDNLSVVGGSVFSTGGHANPTQEIVALALRLAEHLNQKA